MNETVQVFSTAGRGDIAAAIREVLQFDVPAIGTFKDKVLVQRTDLSAEEEILILLHYAGDSGFHISDIHKHVLKAAPTISNSLKRLRSSQMRQVIDVGSEVYRLTELGSRRIREDLAEKLLLD